MAMQRKYPFTPILGWSVSRQDKFDLCKRQYYYDYYGKFDPEFPPQKIAFLKSLTSTHLEIGNVVHDTIATLLHRSKKNPSPVNPDEVMNYADGLVDRAIGTKVFQEVYYGQASAIDATDLKDRVGNCLRHFFGSQWYRWLMGDGGGERGKWVIEPGDFGEFRIDGLKAYCKVDFLFPLADGSLCILEWKTGRIDIERHTRQMKGYVLYARDIFGAVESKVKPVIAYLGDSYQEVANTFSDSVLEEFAGLIILETEQMYRFCEDVQNNIPKAKESFPMEGRYVCAYCSYRELCGR